ncbi:MAG: hypothetical protein ACI845_000215 [Gammaproteobacteria bacterium]|jgi:hypothetical protein
MKTQRVAIREQYMRAWYEMDSGLMLCSISPEFVFEDPAEPTAVIASDMPNYMKRWDERTRALGGNNKWSLTNELRQDDGEILTDWEWWQLLDTPLQGAAVVLTSNRGVLVEKITYFDRNQKSNWAF